MSRIVTDAERSARLSMPRSSRRVAHLRWLGGTLVGLLTVAFGVVVTLPRPAGADQISNLKSQAAQLEQQITSTAAQIDASSQQFDAAQYRLSTLTSQIHGTKQQIAKDQQVVNKDERTLRVASVNAFVTDGTAATQNPLFANNQKSLGLEQEYNNVAEGDISAAVANLHEAQANLDRQESQLQGEQHQAQQDVASAGQAKQQAANLEAQQQAQLSQDKGQIATLVAQQQAAQAAAAQRATQEKLAQAAQQQAAVQQPSTTVTTQGQGGNGPASTTTTAPQAPPTTGSNGQGSGSSFVPPSNASAGAIAVAAAESQLGVPYIWAAADPGVGFDCSGLTMWAWAQAGVSLPHYSGAQMADTTPVPVSDLEPGDLLFYGPGGSQHVAMYIGNGEQIEATTPGSTVMINPLRLTDGFAGAGRP